jgi:hypothetical protein
MSNITPAAAKRLQVLAALREHPELRGVFSLGERIVVATAGGQAIAVEADEGTETLTDEQMKELFTGAAGQAKP